MGRSPVRSANLPETFTGFDVATGSSQCCTFTPCGKFELQDHDAAAENGSYVITTIQHSASDTSYGTSTPGLRMAAGSSTAFAASSALPNRAGRCWRYHGIWSRPTAW